MAWMRKNKDFSDFKPDANTSTWLKTTRLTRQQRMRLLKWLSYCGVMVLALVIQDVIMSQLRLFNATTDLAVCVILMITVLEGTEVGCVFVLLASLFYYFSGSAPNSMVIILLTVLGTGATMLRQMYWHRSKGSIIFCTALALMGYEIGLFLVGVFNELTFVGRFGVFALTGLYSCLVLIPLYPLIYKIGLIGGNTWKE